MAEFLNSGRIRFNDDTQFKTSEMVVLSRHMRFLLGDQRLIVKGGIAKAYECAKQLEEAATLEDHPF